MRGICATDEQTEGRSMGDKVVINLATGHEDADRVTVAFLVATAALEQGRSVAMFTTKAALLRSRELSARELTEACLKRIEERNGGPPSDDGAPEAINAWARVYPELARERAAAADRRLDHQRELAPLVCGIPLAVKDLYAISGLPLTASSRVLADNVAERDATAWARLRVAGMGPP